MPRADRIDHWVTGLNGHFESGRFVTVIDLDPLVEVYSWCIICINYIFQRSRY